MENNKAAIYCQLSVEDMDKINKGDDSESIQNQKLLLMDFAMTRVKGYLKRIGQESDLFMDVDLKQYSDNLLLRFIFFIWLALIFAASFLLPSMISCFDYFLKAISSF